LDCDESIQLHPQVAAEIRRAITEGEAKPGERLPPAKDLAAVLGVNTNTVLRALRELRVAQVNELVTFVRQQGHRLDGSETREGSKSFTARADRADS